MIDAKISDLHALNIHHLQAMSCDFIMTHEKVHDAKLNVIGVRNVLSGTVLDIEQGRLTANVAIAVGKKNIVARVNNDAIGKLDLKLKDHIFVLFGADAVKITRDYTSVFSVLNQITATIAEIKDKNLFKDVFLDIGGDQKIIARINAEDFNGVKLQKGDEVYSIIKSNAIILARPN